MSDIFSADVSEAAKRMSGEWIKGEEFNDEGLVLKLVKPIEKIRASNPKYGAVATDYLVKKEILEEGETLRYSFQDAEGTERKIDSKSSPMFVGFKQVEDITVGDWLHIKRSGERDETRYTVEKVDAPKMKYPQPEDVGVNIDEPAF